MNYHAYDSKRTLSAIYRDILKDFDQADRVHTARWQGVDVSKRPEAAMLELLNVSIHLPQMHSQMEYAANDLGGLVNMPWAENHFAERVCGYPINPGLEWANWPDGQSAAKFLDETGKFNHNYMERYWPKFADARDSASKTVSEYLSIEPRLTLGANFGIRHEYGDLGDLLDLLCSEPDTRQAYLPIFFPEDTGIGDGGRKPCTLGYHFIVRDNLLHVYYPMRSCDFYRHWADDCYLTISLAHWIIRKLRARGSDRWQSVNVGSFTMHCTSLHMFVNDYRLARGA